MCLSIFLSINCIKVKVVTFVSALKFFCVFAIVPMRVKIFHRYMLGFSTTVTYYLKNISARQLKVCISS